MTLAVFGVIGGAFHIGIGRVLGRLGRRSRDAGDLMIQSSTQALRGIKEAKVLGREDYFAESSMVVRMSTRQPSVPLMRSLTRLG